MKLNRKKILFELDRLGWKHKDYAERLGVSKALLSFYLRPGRVKTFRVVEKLAKPLNINPKDLIL